MNGIAVENTRNFCLIGHAGDGKTTLAESILHRAGATGVLGKVDDGSSILNYLPEEKNGHTATITSHLYGFDWSENAMTLIDTPGDPNYAGDTEVVLQASDGAVLLISAVDGMKPGTDKMLRLANASGVVTLAFVSGLDRERADFDRAIESLKGTESNPTVLSIPVGSSAELGAVVDLIRMVQVDASGNESAIPSDLADEAESRRLALVESIAECDDVLLEKYLEEGELREEEVLQGLVSGVHARKLLPVLCGSGATEVGTDLLLREIAELLPSPSDRGEWKATAVGDGSETQAQPTASAPLSAVVFKTIIDRYAGTLSVLRVVSGTLTSDSSLLNASSGSKVRAGKLLRLQGEKHVDVSEAGPGDMVAIAKLKDVRTGNVITSEKKGIRLDEPRLPEGVISYAIQAKTQGDEDKVFTSLGRLVEEDPTLQIGREPSTGEFLLIGMGELHIRTTVHKLKRMFDIDVDLKTPKVPYRETITRSAKNVEGKLKKQTGGKGMFGVCYLDVEPLSRSEGFEFVDQIVGGSIPRGLIPAVEKGVVDACQRGPIAGYPVVDIRVRCVDGKHHPVDSNEMAFKLAGSFAFKSAVEQAQPALLEPVMNIDVSVPDDYVGDVMGDISSRRGRVQSSESRGSGTVITATVPMAEILEYASVLTSMTSGTGTFHLSFAHYDEVPASQREKLIAAARAAQDENH